MQITTAEFNLFAEYIKAHYGIHLTDRKKTLLLSRLASTIERKGYTSFSEYYAHVQADKSGAAVLELLNRVTTNHTSLYRESKHFDFFKEEVLPYIFEKEYATRDMRIWSAGCSEGDEPYTLAMTLRESMVNKIDYWDTSLLATDISDRALGCAREGIYQEGQLSQIPNHWKKQYFEKIDDERFRVKEDIRKSILFRRFNLMHPFPFNRRFHLILCRNVMIYFDNETKNTLIDKFYDSLEPGGYLFIGHSETIDKEQTRFKYIQPAIYRKEVRCGEENQSFGRR